MRKTLTALGMMTVLSISLAACGGASSATTSGGGEAKTSAPSAIEETGSAEKSTEVGSAEAEANPGEATTDEKVTMTSGLDAVSLYFSRVFRYG